MKLTYKEILDSMKNAFYKECGKNVEKFSDVDMRFKAVASEIFAVSSFGDYILKQGFPQTASGNYLDRHAQLRGITRKKPSYAKGKLTFKVDKSPSQNILIPQGTVCASEKLPYIQFATDKDVILRTYATSVDVSATAVKCGNDYNVEENEITVMVNPPQFISSVSNKNAFVGGFDEESDESLRKRILSSYNAKSSGINSRSIRESLLSIDRVLDASVFPDETGKLNVCIKTANNFIAKDEKEEITNLLGFTAFYDIPLNFINAVNKNIYIEIEVKAFSKSDKNRIEAEMEKRVRRVFNNSKIGESLSISSIATSLYGIDGVEYFNVYASNAAGDMISCAKTEFLELLYVGVFVRE